MGEAIVLGLGNNIDYEITWNAKIFEDLIVRYGIREDELSSNKEIHCERDLVVSILSFLKSGAGGERFVFSSDTIERFSGAFDSKITLGGTSVRAAIAMRKLGYTSALHLVTINDFVRSLIPPDSPYVCSSTEDGSYPHLIVQFDKGARVCAGDIDICAGRANRIIYHNDDDNITMQLNPDFAELLADARVFLISGFNAMQNVALLSNRLESLLGMMQQLPEDALVFYEDAGFYDPSFSELIYGVLAGKIGILSLNEDELQAHLGRRVDVLDAEQIAQALADLAQRIPTPVFVVHSMVWALAYGENAQRYSEALTGGITMATTRFRHGDDFTLDDYNQICRLPPNPEGAVFAAALTGLLADKVCCLPVPQVDQSNAVTVGLGDAFVGGFLPGLLS